MKKFNFAITDNTTFYGKDALDFYSQALLGFKTAEFLKLVPNVKSKIKLPQFDLGNILQSDDCSFSGSGEGTLAQKSFEVCDIKLNLEYCTTTFEQNFMSQFMRPGSNTGEVMPQVFERYIIGEVMKKTANDLEKITWQGNSATTSYPYGLCDGLEKTLLADGNVVDVAATASLTSANVITEITKVYNAIPTAVLDKGDVVIFVSTDVFKAYQVAQAASGAGQGYNYAGEKESNFLGLPVILAPGMSSKKMVAVSKNNILLLTDLLSDFTDEGAIRILPQLDKSGAPTVRIVARFKFKADYLLGAEIVYYS